MSEKICMFCVHMDYDAGSSCETCGYGPSFYCKQGHFSSETPSDMEDYRELILKAEESLRWKLIAAQARIETWRTQESSRRAGV